MSITIEKPKGVGLTSKEIKGVLALLTETARKRGLPRATYEYRPPLGSLTKETLYIKPKNQATEQILLRVIKEVLGDNYARETC